MNFTGFGGPFNQFPGKFNDSLSHQSVNQPNQVGAFSVPPLTGQHDPSGRFNGNHFSQTLAVSQNNPSHNPPYAALPQYTQSSVHLHPSSTEHSSSHHHHHHQTGYNNFFNHSDSNKFYHHSTKSHAHHQASTSHKVEKERDEAVNQQILQSANQPWPVLNNNLPSGAGNEYSSHLLSAALPISLQHLLKYSENIKKENGSGAGYNNALNLGMNEASSGFNFNLKNGNLNLAAALGLNQEVSSGSAEVVVPTVTKRAKSAKPRTRNPPAVKKPRERKKKAPKERKPRPKPGEIRETTALDGSKLYLCPECQTAYPDRTLVEQHLATHQVERRFICDICDAALKRKDHLSRHKLSHSQDRPWSCSTCLKTFKRKEQMSLHAIIHSGEKKHVCSEKSCLKAFYRRDHLRKHLRTHQRSETARIKLEMADAELATTTTNNGTTS